MIDRDVAPVAGYAPELGLLLASLEDGTQEWLGEFGELDEAGLTWRPFENGPSVGAQLMHIAAVEAVWIGQLVGGRAPSDAFRRRTLMDATDVDAGVWGEAPRMPLGDYLALLEDVRRTTREVLKGETDAARPIYTSHEGEQRTVRWIVSHVVQHEAYHGGQAVMLKRLYKGAIW